MFISVATMMLWAVVNPVPELERIPTGPLLMIYVFAFGIPTTAVSAFITLSDEMLYPWYELAPRVTALTPLEDQRLGGLIMWIPGMLIFWVAISIVFFRWTKDEYRGWKAEAEELVGAPASEWRPGAEAGDEPSPRMHPALDWPRHHARLVHHGLIVRRSTCPSLPSIEFSSRPPSSSAPATAATSS